jgi:hypothetical protein
MATPEICPWQVISTPRALLEQRFIAIQIRRLEAAAALETLLSSTAAPAYTPTSMFEARLRVPAAAEPLPDCWLHENGAAFSMTPTVPPTSVHTSANALVPGKTIVRMRIWQTALTRVWHEQVYVGCGYCASFASDDQLVLVRLSQAARVPARFKLRHVPEAAPISVLARVGLALGAVPWDPYRVNCHSITEWIITGQLPRTTQVATAANEALFLLISLSLLIGGAVYTYASMTR